jgi:hypothetical protein
MRTLYPAISILAILNMLALGALAGWLRMTDRLDVSRLQEVRHMFAETVTEVRAREAALVAQARQAELEEAERAREAQLPIPAADVLSVRIEHSEADQARIEAIRREIEILQETLRRERRALQDEKAAFNRERAEFERAREVIARTEGDAQFRKALATYEGLKPDRARLALAQLIEQGEAEQVVAYLNAMQERTRTRIIDEFLRLDPGVATDLLERLRTRGLAARDSGNAPG